MHCSLLFFVVLLLSNFSIAPASSSSPRGANTWYGWLGPTNQTQSLLAATYMRDNLLAYGYNSYTIDEGWAEEGGVLLLDANGLPNWNTNLYPSGLPSLTNEMKSMGLQLGLWLMRGIPREAVEKKLPIAGTPYTCDQAVRYDANCSWNRHTYGSNGSPAATAYYAALAAKLVSWGVSFVKFDCLWPNRYEGTPQTYFLDDVIGVAQAIKETNLTLSMSPGISVSPLNASLIAAGSLATMYRIAEDVLDIYDSNPDGTFPQGVHQKFFKALEFEEFLGVNSTWPDFDMLMVGDVFHAYNWSQQSSETHLSPVEQQSQFSLFCFTGVPLLIGGKLPLSNNTNGTRTLALLTQKELLVVHNSSSARNSFTPLSPLYPAAELYGWTNIPIDAAPLNARYVGVFSAGNSTLGPVQDEICCRLRATTDYE
jgi:alpha-galactosidase